MRRHIATQQVRNIAVHLQQLIVQRPPDAFCPVKPETYRAEKTKSYACVSGDASEC